MIRSLHWEALMHVAAAWRLLEPSPPERGFQLPLQRGTEVCMVTWHHIIQRSDRFEQVSTLPRHEGMDGMDVK